MAPAPLAGEPGMANSPPRASLNCAANVVGPYQAPLFWAAVVSCTVETFCRVNSRSGMFSATAGIPTIRRNASSANAYAEYA